MRSVLILLLLFATSGVCMTFAAHHEGRSDLETLYMHLMPANLVVDTHAAETADNFLFAVPAPEALSAFASNAAEVAQGASPVWAVTNLQVCQIAAILLLLTVFSGVPRYLRTGEGDRVTKTFAGFATWIRDDMVFPTMGKELGLKFLPYFLYVFFFILFMNLLGLLPGAATATASVFITAALALTTLFAMIGCGIAAQGPVGFVKGLVPDVPWPLWLPMLGIEGVGLLMKPFALTVRLFANMTGGHMVVLSVMGLIFLAGSFGTTAGAVTAPIAVAFAVFIMLIEFFVAMVQAYVFTQLSIIFVGMCVHPDH